jgi:signal transduction histidine kinase
MEKREDNIFRRFRDGAARDLLERRWLLLVLLGVSAIIFEILEHQHVENPVDAHFIREVVFFGIIYPLGVGLLLNTLLRVQEQRNYILRQREIEQKLSQNLMSAASWDQLCRKIVGFPATVTPAVGVSLFSVLQETAALNLEADWWITERLRRPALQSPPALDTCGVAHHQQEKRLHRFLPSTSEPSSPLNGYCLPLFKDNRWLGLLYLYLPASERLSSDQISILNDIAPAIALALDNIRRQNRSDTQAEAIQIERERIARQLHDTLGQNLAYLRLKLDQISMENKWNEIASVQQDLERMRDIAHEAHEQMRQSLDSLKAEGGENLHDLLLARAQVVAQQSCFTVDAQVSGEPFLLPATAQRKILSIFQEALNNVARHAQASTVHLSIIWDASAPHLMVSMEDDGVGFDLHQARGHNHFGLIIMQQRAEEIQSDLAITSEPGKGTRVELRCPSRS